MKKAYYWGYIPCLFDPEAGEIKTTNWFYGLLIDACIWVDANFNGNFMVVVVKEEEGHAD